MGIKEKNEFVNTYMSKKITTLSGFVTNYYN